MKLCTAIGNMAAQWIVLTALVLAPVIGVLEGQSGLEKLSGQKSANERLFLAAITGDCAQVRNLLDRGADPNVVYNGKFNALIASADLPDGEMMRSLLDAGAKPDVLIDGLTPLTRAVYSPNTQNIERLIQAGASPNLEGQEPTPLAVSIQLGKVDACCLLLKHGASLAPDRNGRNVLVQAINCGQPNLKLIELLIAAGANKTAADAKGCTPLMAARTIGRADIESLLLQSAAN
jgi:uncharacterized protein